MSEEEYANRNRPREFRVIDQDTIELNGKRHRVGKRSSDRQTESLRRKLDIEAAR
jgi:hypothetical protein